MSRSEQIFPQVHSMHDCIKIKLFVFTFDLFPEIILSHIDWQPYQTSVAGIAHGVLIYPL